jgi:hypothetical protein
MTFRKILRVYGPGIRWQFFRLHGEPPNGRWFPLQVMQIIGGRRWSLAITRLGDPQDPAGLEVPDARP